jgi:hypothetical protein
VHYEKIKNEQDYNIGADIKMIIASNAVNIQLIVRYVTRFNPFPAPLLIYIRLREWDEGYIPY